MVSRLICSRFCFSNFIFFFFLLHCRLNFDITTSVLDESQQWTLPYQFLKEMPDIGNADDGIGDCD